MVWFSRLLGWWNGTNFEPVHFSLFFNWASIKYKPPTGMILQVSPVSNEGKVGEPNGTQEVLAWDSRSKRLFHVWWWRASRILVMWTHDSVRPLWNRWGWNRKPKLLGICRKWKGCFFHPTIFLFTQKWWLFPFFHSGKGDYFIPFPKMIGAIFGGIHSFNFMAITWLICLKKRLKHQSLSRNYPPSCETVKYIKPLSRASRWTRSRSL